MLETSAPVGVDPVTITLIGGMVVTVIGAIVTGTVSIITALRVSVVAQQQSTTTTRVDAIAQDTEAIKGHVNSEKTASDGREAALRQEVALLREMLADKKATAGLLAQAVASRSRGGGGDTAPAIATDDTLVSIEQNTAAIERNTK